MKPRTPEETLRCSFCHKSQDAVAKLISSPSDYPRAYICDECVAVCNSILEDDRDLSTTTFADHSLTPQLLLAVERWVRQEASGADAAKELDLVIAIAKAMLRVESQ